MPPVGISFYDNSRKYNMMAVKTKILILGPCGCGKTTIANYLADATDSAEGAYRATQGIRIVEFESNGLELNGRNIDAEVELWDCSGDKKFKKCWPAIQKDTNGVILVANPDQMEQIHSLETWYNQFAVPQNINPNHVLIFLHNKQGWAVPALDPAKLPSSLSHLQVIMTNIEQDGEALRLEFNNFLCNVISGQ